MQASDLKPGQFFEFEPTKERRLCIAQLDDGRCMFVTKLPRNPDRQVIYAIDGCCQSLEVTPLSVTGWDDEPQPTVEPLQLREGWRWVAVGEVIEKGDEYEHAKRWNFAKLAVGCPCTQFQTFCRKVAEVPPPTPEPALCDCGGDVTYGDGVMAIERDCAHCNGTGVEQ